MVAVEWETQSRVRFQSNNVVEFHDGRTADCEFKDEEPHLLEVKSEDIVVVSVGGDVARSCNVTVSGHEVFGLSSIDNYATFVLYGKPLNVTADTNVSLQCPDATDYPLVQIHINDDIPPNTAESCCSDNDLRDGCHRCGKGQYREGLSCQSCEGGKTTEKSGVYLSTNCACPAGYFAGQGNCIMCEAGTYRSFSQIDTECQDCDHTYEQGPGASNCTSDPQASTEEKTTSHPQYLQPRATTCDRTCCVPGEYWNADRQACLDCTDGYNYSDVYGATTCVDCGDLAPGEEMVGCFSRPGSKRACKQGYYRPSGEGTRSCLVCEPGKTTSTTGAASETDCQCKAGFQTQEPFTNCTMCEQGTFKSTISSIDQCQPCSGEYQITRAKGSTSPSSCLCEAGYGLDSSEDQCIRCPAGKYKPDISNSTCLNCEKCETGAWAAGCGFTSKGQCTTCQDEKDCGLDQTCDYCRVCHYNESYYAELVRLNSPLLANRTGKFNSTLDLCGDCGGRTTAENKYEECHHCPPGTTGPSGPRVCNATEEATDVYDIETADQCRECPQCNPGTYKNVSGDYDCLDCPVGTYTDLYGQVSCAACGANMSTSIAGANDQKYCHCRPGFYHNHTNTTPTTHECFRCDPGYYSEALNQHVCTKCPAGQHNNHSDHFDNSSYCAPCPPNTYSPEGAVDCLPCVHATSPAESKDATSCACNAGYAKASSGACVACSPGKYTAESNKSTCDLCSAGTYSNASAATHCQSCPPNTFSEQGATSCTPCVHATSKAESSTMFNCSCNVGYYASAPGSDPSTYCRACPAGTYSSTPNASACTNCSMHTYSTVSGATNSSVCIACPSGKYAQAGSTKCSLCPGNMSSFNSTHCLEQRWELSGGLATGTPTSCQQKCASLGMVCNATRPLTLTSEAIVQLAVLEAFGPIEDKDRYYCKCEESVYYFQCNDYICQNKLCKYNSYSSESIPTIFANYNDGTCRPSQATANISEFNCTELDRGDRTFFDLICSCDGYRSADSLW